MLSRFFGLLEGEAPAEPNLASLLHLKAEPNSPIPGISLFERSFDEYYAFLVSNR